MDDFQQERSSLVQKASSAQKASSDQPAVGETPDLFGDCFVSTAETVTKPRSARRRTGSRSADAPVRASASQRHSSPRKQMTQIDHLAAARKLQWQLRRTRSHSPEEVKTGRLICRHLLALLNEANDANESLTQKSA